ncbi:hypothetical protein B0O80DRAFT_280665 [Mortierella sp. GBAus27b]|nr:hypothetical protein B0O80DRAFT_280665 [Mortierella sp. GBAus27b]
MSFIDTSFFYRQKDNSSARTTGELVGGVKLYCTVARTACFLFFVLRSSTIILSSFTMMAQDHEQQAPMQQQPQQREQRERSNHLADEPAAKIASSSSECSLWSLIQYECDLSPERIVCRPVYRIMKKCKGMPTVEVTPLYDTFGNVLHH